jgi:uncharacterized protein
MSRHGLTSLLILQPTPFCNIDCSYCYLPHRSDRTVLAIDDLRRIFTAVFKFPTITGHVTILWHAGEPLVPGTAYYRAAFSCIRKLCPADLQISHCIQTNGMLIDDDWCDLFREWDVSVGVSIDGPERIHDQARKTRSGHGTYAKTIAGIECLQRKGVPFYIISVLTKMALLDPDALFMFYREYDIRDVGFNIDEQEGDYKASSLSDGVDDHAVIDFFARFSALMTEHRFPIAVRELDESFMSIRFLQKQGPMNNLVVPFGIVTIDVHGGVYTFSPELAGYSAKNFPTFSIGNIFTDTFDQLANSAVMHRMTAEINEGVEKCRSECKYFPVCGGGAPSNKIFENESFASTETLHCRFTKKRVTDFVLSAIEEAGRSALVWQRETPRA